MNEIKIKNPNDIFCHFISRHQVINPDTLGYLVPQGDRFRDLLSYIDQSWNSEATERNFSVRCVKSKSGKLKIDLVKEDGTVCNLNDFLPLGYRLVSGKEPLASVGFSKRVEMPEQDLTKKGGLLSLFHEIGHAAFGNDGHAYPGELAIAGLQAGLRRRKIAKEAKRQGKQYLVADILPNIVTLDESAASSLLPDWYKDKHYADRAKSERGAWAFALLMMRRLEDEGFNVLSDFDGIEDLEDFIDSNLRTYEYGRELDKKCFYQDRDGYKPIYVRKTDGDELEDWA